MKLYYELRENLRESADISEYHLLSVLGILEVAGNCFQRGLCNHCPFNKKNNKLDKTCTELGVQKLFGRYESYSKANQDTCIHALKFLKGKTIFIDGVLNIDYSDFDLNLVAENLSVKDIDTIRNLKPLNKLTPAINIPDEIYRDLVRIGLSYEEIDTIEYCAKEFGVYINYGEKGRSIINNKDFYKIYEPQTGIDFLWKMILGFTNKPDVCHAGYNGNQRVVWANHYFFRARALIKKNSNWNHFWGAIEKICIDAGEDIGEIWNIPILEIEVNETKKKSKKYR